MAINVYDRKNMKLYEEKVSGKKQLEYLYSSPTGKLLLEKLVKRKLFQSVAGAYCSSRLSSRLINKFIKDYSINLDEAIVPKGGFKTFNEFFIRRMKPTSRPIDENENVLVSPGDGRLSVTLDIDPEKILLVKGIEYSFKELLHSDSMMKKYDKGIAIVLRLNPTDYHRVHFPDSGRTLNTKKIRGHYYSVNPIALSAIADVFTKNKREWTVLKSDNFKDILIMEVGATNVGSIVQTYKPGSYVKKGAEKSYFKFGGSTVLMFLEKDSVIIDEDIIENSYMGIESLVKMGERIANKRKEL